MRPWFIVALLYAVLTLGCASLVAEPALVRPPRSLPLETLISNSYTNGVVRINETVWLRPYNISGESGLPGVRRQLDELGPVSDVAKTRFDGLTAWGLRWGFNYNDSAGACSVRTAEIEIEAVITLPELDVGELSDEDGRLWTAYVDQLRAHEDGHVNIYRAGAQELSNEITALGEMPSCDELRLALSALGDAKIERISQADLQFDRETGHGAIFPAIN